MILSKKIKMLWKVDFIAKCKIFSHKSKGGKKTPQILMLRSQSMLMHVVDINLINKLHKTFYYDFWLWMHACREQWFKAPNAILWRIIKRNCLCFFLLANHLSNSNSSSNYHPTLASMNLTDILAQQYTLTPELFWIISCPLRNSFTFS